MKRVAAATLGCKVNQYDTEAILKQFVKRGYKIVEFDDDADIYIINTCTVTNTGDKKSRQMIRRAKARNAGALIVAAGCYSQVSPEEVANISGVDIVAGTGERDVIADLVEGYISKHENIPPSAPERRDVETDGTVTYARKRTRAYIKVQDGCDRFCAYCIVPYARGAVRSRGMEEIVSEARFLAEAGYKEIVVTGIHVASYGKDLGYEQDLTGLLKRVHAVAGLERIRLGSIEPGLVTPGFIDAVRGLPKLCDHFHLSLQSGCDKTLRAMNRRYSAAEYAESAALLRSAFPDVSLTTDIIVGFPGESEADFEESMVFAEAMGFLKIHVFPYSPKKGTPAAGFPGQVPDALKRERTEKMLRLSERSSHVFRSRFKGRVMDALIEAQVSERGFKGYTTNYLMAHTRSDVDIQGSIVRVVIK